MSIFSVIISVVGVGLLILSSVSGYTLLLRATGKTHHLPNDPDYATLWGLFATGLLVSLPMLWFVLP